MVVGFTTTNQGLFFPPKFAGPGPVSIRILLVLNIGMKETKFVEHKINWVTEWHILFEMAILGSQFYTWSDAAVHLIL